MRKEVLSPQGDSNQQTLVERITERWQYKLLFTGLALLIYMTGAINLDATVGCYERNINAKVWNYQGANYTTDCVTWDLLGRDPDLKNSYHSALWFMNIAVAIIIVAVLWI